MAHLLVLVQQNIVNHMFYNSICHNSKTLNMQNIVPLLMQYHSSMKDLSNLVSCAKTSAKSQKRKPEPDAEAPVEQPATC